MRVVSSVLSLCFIGVALQVGARADETSRVLISIESDGRFEVLYSRAGSSAVGFLLLGGIGYGIEEGSRAGEDNEREAQVLKFIPDDDCRAQFVAAVSERLAERGYDATIVGPLDSVPEGFDYVVRTKIRACGFKLANSTTSELTAFYAFSYRVTPYGKGTEDEQDVLITGTHRGDWDEILAEPDVARAEFDKARRNAGRRLGNKLIYRKDDD